MNFSVPDSVAVETDRRVVSAADVELRVVVTRDAEIQVAAEEIPVAVVDDREDEGDDHACR